MIKSPTKHKMVESPEDASILTKQNRIQRKRQKKIKSVRSKEGRWR